MSLEGSMLAALTTLAQTVPSIDFSPVFSPAPDTTAAPSFDLANPFFLVGALVIGLISLVIWRNKGGSPVVGFLWGFLLGLIGLLVVAVAKPSGTRKVKDVPAAQTQAWQQAVAAQTPQRPCPQCGQGIPADQPMCPSCRQPSEPWRMQNGVWITRNDNRDWWLNPSSNQWQLHRINKFCPSCRGEMQPQDAACPECGALSNAIGGI
jgi:predicted RNA-binding Zn-ribbon protein involved in translation (DUF1610 family)